jgi:hypothetical protein
VEVQSFVMQPFLPKLFGHLANSPERAFANMQPSTPMWSFLADRWQRKIRFVPNPEPTPIAVAVDTASAPTAEQSADVHDDSEVGDCSSIAGDTVADSSGAETDEAPTAVAARRQQRVAPKTPLQGIPNKGRGPSAPANNDPEVGNFGLFFGNWGQRATLGGDAHKKARRQTHDRQLLKCPAQVIVLCEACEGIEELLRQAPEEGTPEQAGLEGRCTYEYFVVRGAEPEAAVLIAARMDNTTFLECLEYEVHNDHNYTEKGKPKQARSRMLVCKVGFKQNVGHLGKELVVCGVHGHYRTMKFEWPQALQAFWDRLAKKIRAHRIQFLAGDFNMSVTEVVKQLRSRGIESDCIAWYPWQHMTSDLHGQKLGLDSCGIFYIGGSVQVSLHWGFNHIDILTAVAEEQHADEDSWTLDVYRGTNHPGQHWAAYRSRALNEPSDQKNLKNRLEDLLLPSTTQRQLKSIIKREGSVYCPYLRFKQKQMDRSEWLVKDEVHNGAHFPLCVFTNNARARSQAKALERSQKKHIYSDWTEWTDLQKKHTYSHWTDWPDAQKKHTYSDWTDWTEWTHHHQYAEDSKHRGQYAEDSRIVTKACTQETCAPAVAEAHVTKACTQETCEPAVAKAHVTKACTQETCEPAVAKAHVQRNAVATAHALSIGATGDTARSIVHI